MRLYDRLKLFQSGDKNTEKTYVDIRKFLDRDILISLYRVSHTIYRPLATGRS